MKGPRDAADLTVMVISRPKSKQTDRQTECSIRVSCPCAHGEGSSPACLPQDELEEPIAREPITYKHLKPLN